MRGFTEAVIALKYFPVSSLFERSWRSKERKDTRSEETPVPISAPGTSPPSGIRPTVFCHIAVPRSAVPRIDLKDNTPAATGQMIKHLPEQSSSPCEATRYRAPLGIFF